MSTGMASLPSAVATASTDREDETLAKLGRDREATSKHRDRPASRKASSSAVWSGWRRSWSWLPGGAASVRTSTTASCSSSSSRPPRRGSRGILFVGPHQGGVRGHRRAAPDGCPRRRCGPRRAGARGRRGRSWTLGAPRPAWWRRRRRGGRRGSPARRWRPRQRWRRRAGAAAAVGAAPGPARSADAVRPTA